MYSHHMASGAQNGVLTWISSVHISHAEHYASTQLIGAHTADHTGEAAVGCDEPALTAIPISLMHAAQHVTMPYILQAVTECL